MKAVMLLDITRLNRKIGYINWTIADGLDIGFSGN
jgi:hypothetical protein